MLWQQIYPGSTSSPTATQYALLDSSLNLKKKCSKHLWISWLWISFHSRSQMGILAWKVKKIYFLAMKDDDSTTKHALLLQFPGSEVHRNFKTLPTLVIARTMRNQKQHSKNTLNHTQMLTMNNIQSSKHICEKGKIWMSIIPASIALRVHMSSQMWIMR